MTVAPVSALSLGALLLDPRPAHAQTVDDGSGAAIGPENTKTILDLVARHLNSPDAKVTALRRSAGAAICGSVNVKNRDGLYTGERGFVADLATGSFGRIPDGPELLSPKAANFQSMDELRQLYFRLCLDRGAFQNPHPEGLRISLEGALQLSP